MDKSIIEKFVGKTVQLWPGDTDGKVVKILGAVDTGVLVQGVKHKKCWHIYYKDEQIHFLSWSHKIDFIPLD